MFQFFMGKFELGIESIKPTNEQRRLTEILPTYLSKRVLDNMAQSAASAANSLPTLYSELNRFGESGEFERALKTANKSKPTPDNFIQI